MTVTREEFLKPRPLKVKECEIAEIGVVRIKQLSKAELCDFQKWLRPKGELNADRFAKRDLMLICKSVVDNDERPLFTVDDIEKLAELPGQPIDDLAYQVMVFNGYMEAVEVDDDLLGKSDS